MREPEIISQNGKKITYLNYSNIKDQDEIFRLIDRSADFIQNQPPNSVLSLVNVENMHFNNSVKNHLQNQVKENTPFVSRSAIIGMKGLISVMFNSFQKFTGRNIKSFSTKEEAIDYLTM